jgi:hypothetical protein
MSNAHRRDSTGDNKQRGRRHTWVVRPADTPTNAISCHERNAAADRYQAKPRRDQQPDPPATCSKTVIHNSAW